MILKIGIYLFESPKWRWRKYDREFIMKSNERTDLQQLRKLLFDFKAFCIKSIDQLIEELDKPVRARSVNQGPRRFKGHNTYYHHRRRIRTVGAQFKSVTSFMTSFLFVIYKFYGIRHDKITEIKKVLEKKMEK